MNMAARVGKHRRIIRAAAGAVLVTSLMMLLSPQVRAQVPDKLIDDAANTIVSQIQGESCGDFAATLQKIRSGSSSSRVRSMLKNNRAARERFVNKVAGPLVNKMIDCDLLPSR